MLTKSRVWLALPLAILFSCGKAKDAEKDKAEPAVNVLVETANKGAIAEDDPRLFPARDKCLPEKLIRCRNLFGRRMGITLRKQRSDSRNRSNE